MILIKILSCVFVFSLPFDYQVHDTLEKRRPDLCECKDVKPAKGRIYGIDVNDNIYNIFKTFFLFKVVNILIETI